MLYSWCHMTDNSGSTVASGYRKCLGYTVTVCISSIDLVVRERLCVFLCIFKASRLLSGEGDGTPLQYSCLENPMDGGAWWAAVHGVAKSRTRLRDFTFAFRFHALEKEMATHSRVLAWRIPGMVEPGGLPSMGSHRVRHDWRDSAEAAVCHSLNGYVIVLKVVACPFLSCLRRNQREWKLLGLAK